MGVSNLEEFFKVARLNVFVEYFICLFIIPVFFSYLPDPTPRKLKYLKSKPVIKELSFFSGLVNCYPAWIYGIAAVAIVFSFWGIYNMQSISYMVDDLPEESPI